MIDPDADEYVESQYFRGRIDHSTAGAQWVWQRLGRYGEPGRYCAQILATCLASHHSGLIDCLKPEAVDGFKKRIEKQIRIPIWVNVRALPAPTIMIE